MTSTLIGAEACELHVGLPADREPDLIRLLGRVFGPAAAIRATAMLNSHPLLRREHWIYCTDAAGRIVSCLCLIPQEWRLGSEPLRAGQLEFVATDPDFRRLGLVRRQMKAFGEMLRRERCLVSCIQGVPGFYRQFGYEYSIPLKGGMTVLPSELPDGVACGGASIRSYRDGDEAAVRELYDSACRPLFIQSRLTEELVRYQQGQPEGSDRRYRTLMLEGADGVDGYLRMLAQPINNTLVIREIGARQYQGFLALLSEAKRYAMEAGLPTINLRLPPCHAGARAMELLGGLPKTPWAWQTRVLDWFAFLRTLGPVLERRLGATWFAGWSGEIQLNLFDAGGIRLAFREGRLVAVDPEVRERFDLQMSSGVLSILAFGVLSVKETLARHPDCEICPASVPLVDVLFPKQPSFVYEVY